MLPAHTTKGNPEVAGSRPRLVSGGEEQADAAVRESGWGGVGELKDSMSCKRRLAGQKNLSAARWLCTNGKPRQLRSGDHLESGGGGCFGVMVTI